MKPSYVQKNQHHSLIQCWHIAGLILRITFRSHSWDKVDLLYSITLGMSRHAWKHPFEATKQYLLLYGTLVTSKSSNSYLNLFVGFSSLKDLAFWLALRLLDRNSRTRFLPNMLFFCKKLKDIWNFCVEAKSIYIWVNKIFAKTLKTSTLILFEVSEFIWTFIQKPGSVTFLTFQCLISWKKNLRWLPNSFPRSVYIRNLSCSIVVHFCETCFIEVICITRSDISKNCSQ